MLIHLRNQPRSYEEDLKKKKSRVENRDKLNIFSGWPFGTSTTRPEHKHSEVHRMIKSFPEGKAYFQIQALKD